MEPARLFTLYRIQAILLLMSLTLGPTAVYTVVVCLGFVSLAIFLLDREHTIFPTRPFSEFRAFPLLATGFFLASLASILLSDYAKLSDIAEFKWIPIFLSFLPPAFFLLHHWHFDRAEKVAFSILLLLIGLQTAVSVYQWATGVNLYREFTSGESLFGNRSTGMLRNPITYGQLMGILFWLSIAGFIFARQSGKTKITVIAAVFSLLTFATLVMTQSRGAWLALAGSTLVSFFIIPWKIQKQWIPGLAVAVLIGIVSLLLSGSLQNRLASAFDADNTSNRHRLDLWQANWEILKEHPFGIGYNANDQLIKEKLDSLELGTWDAHGHSHSEYVEIAVGCGWLGFLLYLLIVFGFLGASIHHLKAAVAQQKTWISFLLLWSVMNQVFVAFATVTDQINTPLRVALSFSWALGCLPLFRSNGKEDKSPEKEELSSST